MPVMRKRPGKRDIYWTLHRLLGERGMTAYALTKRVQGISPNTVYRAAREDTSAGRATGKTLAALCDALDCQPGDLLEYREARKR